MIGALGSTGRLGLSSRRQLWTPLRASTAPVLGVDAARTDTLVLSGNSASQWNTLLGTANLTQATGSAQLTYESTGFGGYAPCLASDGGDWMQATISNLRNFTSLDVYMVVQSAAAAAVDTNSIIFFGLQDAAASRLAWASNTALLTGEQIQFAHTGDGRLASSSYARAANVPQIVNMKNSTTGTSLFANGSAVALNLSNVITTSTNTSPASIGMTADVFYLFTGGATNFIISPAAKVKELWVFPSLLLSEDRVRMEGYLAHNNWRIYGQPVPLPSNHPYFSVPPY